MHDQDLACTWEDIYSLTIVINIAICIRVMSLDKKTNLAPYQLFSKDFLACSHTEIITGTLCPYALYLYGLRAENPKKIATLGQDLYIRLK